MRIALFLSLIFFSGSSFAGNDFNYELVRTKESPGFFMAKIFASENAAPLNMKEVFVKNFSKKEEGIYRDLFPFLQQQRQARIINKEEFYPEKLDTSREIIIFLGEPMDGFLNFKYDDSEEIFNQFQNFARKNLSPVLLNDLKINFGGNIYDVQTKQDKITIDSPAIFIGKFKNTIKTRMEVSGETLDSSFSLVSPIDLSDKKATLDKTAEYLPELWENLAHPKGEKRSESNLWGEINLLKLLPYFLVVIIIFIIYLFIKFLMRYNASQEDFHCEEEVPIFHTQISEEEYQSYEKAIGNQKEELETPFEVIWKK